MRSDVRCLCRFLVPALLVFVPPALDYGVTFAERPDPRRWEPEIAALEAAAESSAGCDVVFVGSSTIRLWDLNTSFPGMNQRNHGFGGSHLADATYYAKRLVTRFHPRMVVIYAGDNDIAAGLTPSQVAADYQGLVRAIRAAQPDVEIVFIGIKPSRARWEQYPQMKAANRLIKASAARCRREHFVDIETIMLNQQGQPRSDYLAADGLHLSTKGYTAWSRIVKSVLAPLIGLPESELESHR